MDITIIVALIGAVSTFLGVWVTYVLGRRNSDSARIVALEARLDAIQAQNETLRTKNRLLWRFCRQLIIHIDTGKGSPAPDWPEDLNEPD